jgi:hypothetical protein
MYRTMHRVTTIILQQRVNGCWLTIACKFA